MKQIYLLLFVLFLVGCSASTSIKPDDYNATMDFLRENFEATNVPTSNIQPGYLAGYEIKDVAKDIKVALNASNQIVAIQFDKLSAMEVEMILGDIGKDIDDDLELLLSYVDEFTDLNGQSHFTYSFIEGSGVHILGYKTDMLEAMNVTEPYDLNIFYNESVYNDFLNQ